MASKIIPMMTSAKIISGQWIFRMTFFRPPLSEHHEESDASLATHIESEAFLNISIVLAL